MPWALHNSARTYFTILQGPARVRTSAFKTINLLIELNDADKMR